jgi:hypothetical protein
VGALLSDIATEIAEAGAAKITAGQELVPGKEVDQFLWARDYQAGDSELAMKKIIDHFGETVADAAAMYARTDVEIRAALVEFVVPALAAAVANKRR